MILIWASAPFFFFCFTFLFSGFFLSFPHSPSQPPTLGLPSHTGRPFTFLTPATLRLFDLSTLPPLPLSRRRSEHTTALPSSPKPKPSRLFDSRSLTHRLSEITDRRV
ncbi:hypothetical protein ACB092_07G059700 [Castanea dentata]